MMNLTRWQPQQELLPLREAMDRLFQDAFFRPFFGNGEAWSRPGSSWLPMDVIDHGQEYEVRAVVPGYEPDQIDISIQDNTLTLRGTVREEQEKQEPNYYLREWRAGSFQRSIQLPTGVNSDKAEAHYRNGILTLRLPKVETALAKKIKVKTK